MQLPASLKIETWRRPNDYLGEKVVINARFLKTNVHNCIIILSTNIIKLIAVSERVLVRILRLSYCSVMY